MRHHREQVAALRLLALCQRESASRLAKRSNVGVCTTPLCTELIVRHLATRDQTTAIRLVLPPLGLDGVIRSSTFPREKVVGDLSLDLLCFVGGIALVGDGAVSTRGQSLASDDMVGVLAKLQKARVRKNAITLDESVPLGQGQGHRRGPSRFRVSGGAFGAEAGVRQSTLRRDTLANWIHDRTPPPVEPSSRETDGFAPLEW